MLVGLKELRLKKGITQAELADLLGVSPSTIGMYEQGRREPDSSTVKWLAEYFGVSADILLGVQTDQKDKAIDETMALYEKLSPEEKEKAKAFIQFMISQK